jgi:integrase
MKITQRFVEAAKPGFYWDEELKGFGLKVTPHKKVFIVQKRPHKGAKALKRWTLGAYPVLSLTEARTQAKTLLATLTLGGSLPATRSQSGGSFSSEIENYYHNHIVPKLKPSTQVDMRYMIDKHLIPTFGKLTLAEVTPSLVRSFHTRLGSKHPYRANRVLALLSKFCAWQHLEPNPCKGIEKFRERRREPTELTVVSRLLDPSVHPVIRLLILTGMRKSEVLGLRWEWVNTRSGTIHFPDSKTGRKTVYLSQPAQALLTEVGVKPEGWVFPGGRWHPTGGHFVQLQKLWKRTLRELGLSDDIRIHDLRHHYASQASRTCSMPLVAGLLGHKDIKTTMRYVHSTQEDLRLAAQTVGKKLADQP